jgi:hypothetical protein
MTKHLFVYGLILLSILSCCDIDNEFGNNYDGCGYQGFYYYDGSQQPIGELSSEYLLIGSDTTNRDDRLIEFINQNSNFENISLSDINHYSNYRYNLANVKFRRSKNCKQMTSIIEMLEEESLIDFVHFTIKTDDCTNAIWEEIGERCVDSYSNLFIVKVLNSDDLSNLDSIANKTNTRILYQNEFMENWFTLEATKLSQGDALQMANYFYESGLFEETAPDIIKLVVE